MVETTASATSLPPEEAISFLRGKANVTSQRWTDVWQEAHTRSFMVAGAATQALVGDFRDAVARAIEQGTTLSEFRKSFESIVEKHGWVHNGTAGWRSQIIYETNLSMAYSAGRYSQMSEPDTLRVYPYWQYMHTSSARPRPQHLAWVGTTLRADDGWWGTHYPPNGWRCRCSVRPVSEAGLQRQGKAGPDTAPPVDLRPWRSPDGRINTMVPHGIDPGFGYNPGASWGGGAPPTPGSGPLPPAPLVPAPAAPRALPVAPRPPPVEPSEMARPFARPGPLGRAPAPTLPIAEAVVPPPAPVEPGFSDWVDGLLETRKPDGSVRVVGALSPGVMDALKAAGTAPANATLSIRASDMLHIARDVKVAANKVVPVVDLRRLPELLAAPKAVLRERKTGNLLYVFTPSDPDEARLGKLVVQLLVVAKLKQGGARSREPINAVKSAGLVPEQALRNAGEYDVIEGSL